MVFVAFLEDSLLGQIVRALISISVNFPGWGPPVSFFCEKNAPVTRRVLRYSGVLKGWDRQLADQLREAERWYGPIGVAAVYGGGEMVRRFHRRVIEPRMSLDLGRTPHKDSFSARWGASCPRQGNLPTQSGSRRHR
jgi:hypothetical protein